MTHLVLSVTRNIFFGNSEASASELLENHEEMFFDYYMESDIIGIIKYSNTIQLLYHDPITIISIR